MADKARHAFGALEGIDNAISAGKIDSYDILFVKDTNGKPYVGWIDKDGQKVIVDDSVELAAMEAQIATKANAEDLAQIESELSTKANIADVDAKLEAALTEHLVKKYEIADVPVGTLVSVNEREIRIMCPIGSVFTKQTVGKGGDANTYYCTLKTYAPDDAVGYIEHLGGQVDEKILTDLKTDKYGRKYQPTWLGIAKYDESADTWNYYGKNSTKDKYIGWDYQIDFYDANGVMIASDCIRINLSNEDCHSSIKPYYGVSTTEEIDNKVEEAVEEKVTEKVEEAVNTANAYTDAQIEAKIAEVASAYEVIEF